MLDGVANRLFAVACFGLASVQAATAADLGATPAYPPGYTAAPMSWGWTGFYLGGQLGFGGDTVQWDNIGASARFSPLGSVTRDHNTGVIGGGQIGYNFQTGSLVFGLEGSLSGVDFSSTMPSPYAPATGAWSSRANWLSTVTGRAGYSFGQWLPYIKGGFATANLDTRLQDVGGIGAFAQSSSQHYGWTAGAGIEYKVTSKWSLGLEYLYSDLGRNTDINAPAASLATGAPLSATPETYTTGLRSQSVMGRLNYKIGW
jgi:outer membrane immunogenic protein